MKIVKINFYVYVIGSKKKNKVTYVGWTNNLKKRIYKHNLSLGAKFTRGRKWKILYFESFDSKIKAMKREFVLKRDKKFRYFLRNKI